ncbi:MAG: hypothetical protein QOE77_2009 [Blastocatellia bacterium]|jgi:hypothetical protein|nr:hypothetical protein [Blastocatellia bacterium]
MKQHLIHIFLITLIIAPVSPAENDHAFQAGSTNIKEISTNKAGSGFYLEIKRSYIRAYPGWQQDTITRLRAKGFAAFNAEPKDEIRADGKLTAQSLEQIATPKLVISSVYVGPYMSEKTAKKMIPKVLSALRPLMVEEKKNDELNNRYLFLIGVVKVI